MYIQGGNVLLSFGVPLHDQQLMDRVGGGGRTCTAHIHVAWLPSNPEYVQNRHENWCKHGHPLVPRGRGAGLIGHRPAIIIQVHT